MPIFSYFRLVMAEHRKVEIVTRLLMALEFVRVCQVVFAYYLSNAKSMAPEQWIYACAAAFILALVSFNIKRPLTAVLSLIIIYKFDFIFNCNSISTALFSFLCLFIAAYNYFIINDKKHTARTLEILYALLWMAYGYINFSSAWNHLSDPYWENGYAMELFFSHSYYGNFYNFFRQFQQHQPYASHILFKCVTYSVLISQFLLIPLYYIKWGRLALRIWAIVLLITIGIFLKISLLPHFSALLFILIFWRKETNTITFNLLIPTATVIAPLRKIMFLFYGFFGLSLCLHTPVLNKTSDLFFWTIREWDTKNWLNKKLAMLGFHKPDVFNTNHVEGGQRWFVIYRLDNNHKQLVRFFDVHGARLTYSGFDPLGLQNHGSDYLYFGNTVQYVLGNDSVSYENSATPYRFKGNAITRLITFDFYRKSLTGPTRYAVDFYERPFKTENGKPSWNTKASKVGTHIYLMNDKSQKIDYPILESKVNP